MERYFSFKSISFQLFIHSFIYFNITIYIYIYIICIFFFSTKLNLNPIELKIHPMYFNSIQSCMQCYSISGFFLVFCGEFLSLDDKRKGLVNLIKEILRIVFLNCHILRKKKVRSHRI
jgi:hypothetical protein